MQLRWCHGRLQVQCCIGLIDMPGKGHAAPQVMQTLKDLCQEGHTVISSIHQPRSSIFAMFDDLILLSEGRMLYSGPAQKALPYFEEMGHKCPQHYNPAEFLADLISVDSSTPKAQHKTRQAPHSSGKLASACADRHILVCARHGCQYCQLGATCCMELCLSCSD